MAEMGIVKQNLHMAWLSIGHNSKTLSVYVALTGAFAVHANVTHSGGAADMVMDMQVCNTWGGCRRDVLLMQGWDDSCPTSVHVHWSNL